MDAEFSVELGPSSEEPTLEFPWSSGVDGGPCYVDVKRHPELLPLVGEAAQYPELGEFLLALNSRQSWLETAKCDVWATDQLAMEEEDYGAKWKLGSYLDIIFGEERAAARFSFPAHEDWARSLTQLLKQTPDLPAACEAVVRRCYYHTNAANPAGGVGGTESGFYLTLYVSGYGHDEPEARRHWGTALRFAADACRQLSLGHGG
jgi:hypothetical protein